jgi:hypothetical protein
MAAAPPKSNSGRSAASPGRNLGGTSVPPEGEAQLRPTSPGAGDRITNVELGFIHEFGSPVRNIPARSFLRPGVEKAMPQITVLLRQAAQAAIAGDAGAADTLMRQAGEVGVESVRRTIAAGIPPPLAQATVNRRRIRTPGSRYRRRATTAAQTVPLWDTGQLIRSLAYVIR